MMSGEPKRVSHLPPPRYKSSARPWCDIPGFCGYFLGQDPNRKPCCKTATHRCKGSIVDGKATRYGWLCKEHASVLNYATKMNSEDAVLIKEGRICDVWKCQRRAARWTDDGYAICFHCSGN